MRAPQYLNAFKIEEFADGKYRTRTEGTVHEHAYGWLEGRNIAQVAHPPNAKCSLHSIDVRLHLQAGHEA